MPLGRPSARRRAAFWHLGRANLCVAVIERTREEPLLLACAHCSVSTVQASVSLCPGVLELALATAATGLAHVVGLGGEDCMVEQGVGATADAEPPTDGGSPAGAGSGRLALDQASPALRRRVQGLDATAVAYQGAVAAVENLFAQARLTLAAIDCEACALHSLGEALGVAGEAASLDPLAAVCVAAACEEEAAGLGSRLAVPVGLALARFGSFGRDG